MSLKDHVQKLITGEVYDDSATLDKYSTDASIFTIKPQLVTTPKDSHDIQELVKFVNSQSGLSLVPRSAGTCMSGGPLSESIVLDMTTHFNQVIEVGQDNAITQPGVFYRDFEKETLKKDLLLPCYTSSREINTVGGMVGNNSAGEKTLSYGQTEKYVKKLKVIFSNGKEYTVEPLTKTQLDNKMQQKDFEGQIYRKIYGLITDNQDLITNAKPKTSKNSTGYYLWNVWNGKTFDLNKLIVGSQGTLGIVTEIEFQLVHPKKYSNTVIINLNLLDNLDQIINEVLKLKPESFECYDDQTLRYAVKYLSEIIKDVKGRHDLTFYLQFIPEMIMRWTNNFPKLTLLTEYTSDDPQEIADKCAQTTQLFAKYHLKTQVLSTKQAEKFWIIRRQSFSLLRHHTVNMRTAPFIDDIIVNPEHLPEFLPKLNSLFEPYNKKLIYTLAGHIGNGNFHIIPLLDITDPETRAMIPELAQKVFDLVFSYQGSMAAEHNDGLVRGPYLEQMYGEEMYELFKEVKFIFDPKGIFNPNKKAGATFKYSYDHLSESN